MSIQEKHIALVEAVNSAKTESAHREAAVRLEEFRIALDLIRPDGWGLVNCDMHYLNQGIDRPMCAGVFLDWQPS